MNFALKREIYGANAWCIDALSYGSLSQILKDNRNGVVLELPETKYNSPQIYNAITKTIQYGWQLNNSDEFEAVGVINLNGAITLSGGESTVGMEQLAQNMLFMSKDKRIKAFVVYANSGGGSSNAVQVMKDTINQIKLTKPVYGLVKKGGMAASACYGILSSCQKIYSESEMNIVGSLGTMIEFSGYAANTTLESGEKVVRLYATKSVNKNKAIEEALNNDNYELLINEMLDPINENFLNSIIQDRPQLSSTTWDDGAHHFSKNVIGTFIDGIASFDEVVSMLETESKIVVNNVNKVKFNSNSKMTRDDLKSQFPSVHAEIVKEGITQERERVASWLTYQSADPEMVANGIESGEAITPSQREKLMVKMNSLTMLEAMKGDNATTVTTTESTTVQATETTEDVAQSEVNDFYANLAKKI
jgi:ClpP class serine protease